MKRAARNWPLDLLRGVLLLSAVLSHAVVAISVGATYGTAEFSRRDWSVFREAGARVVNGQLDDLYAAQPGDFPYLHPPFVAALFAPLAGLGEGGVYGTMVLLQLMGLTLAIVALRHLNPRHAEQDVVLLGTVASAPWLIGVLLGQPTALFLGLWLVAFALLVKKRPLMSGLFFGLCAIKPPFVVAPMAFVLLTRRWRVGVGIGISIGALVALGLVVGHYGDWVEAMRRTFDDVGAGEIPLWKQHTLLAFLYTCAARPAALAAYGLAWMGTVPLLLRARHQPVPLLRVAGWLALGTIALGPYAYFYDALLLAVPAAALWLERASYPARRALLLAAVAALTYGWHFLGFLYLQSGPAYGGALVTLWLTAELLSGAKNAHARAESPDPRSFEP